jgi:opacity protein-like surface antigen
MRRLAPVLALAAVMAIAGTAVAKQPGKLTTFGTGDASLSGGVLTLHNDAGEYSGVYLKSISRKARPLESVHFSFNRSGDVQGGAPRFSIPIDTNRNGQLDGYAFIDVNSCGGSTTVSTEASTCGVYFRDNFFANWAAMADANPSWRLASGKVPFIIADVAGDYVVWDIDLR